MANDYVFFDPRKKAQQQAEDEKKLSEKEEERLRNQEIGCLLYTSPSPRDLVISRMPSSA